jgi:DNA mismatch endonuclease (patch repair protein)
MGGPGITRDGASRTVFGMADSWTPEARSKLMSRVRTRDTAPEVALRRALWALGVRGWRLHAKDLPGRPDLVFRAARLAVFVDGAFWHGHPSHYKGQSGAFWDTKIARNRERDKTVNRELAALGWKVLRLWDFEIESEAEASALRVRDALQPGTNERSTSVRWRR